MFEALRERLDSIFDGLRGKGKLTEEDVNVALREVRRALLEADVDYKIVKSFISGIRERAVGQEVLESITPAQQVIAIVYDRLLALMGDKVIPLTIASKPPTICLMVGLQGSGKTTSTVKLAKKFAKVHKPLVVACDLRRPAAVEQLRILAEQAEVAFFGPGEKNCSDVLSVVKDALNYATENLIDLIFLDTAGRLHVDNELMEELKNIKDLALPQEILLTVDAMTGQEAVKVASTFNDKLSITGVILSKLDGDARGGAALSVRAATGIPIKYAGIGEGIDALETFDAKRMAQRILGMGDVAGLAEKVQQVASQGDVEKLAKSFKRQKLTMNDLLLQFEQIEKMGPLDKVLDMIPGAGKIKGIKEADLDPGRIGKAKAIILSMTKEEREKPQIIKGSRRRRIAMGSGTSVQMVNQLLKQHDQMNQLWKKLGKSKGRKRVKLPGNFF